MSASCSNPAVEADALMPRRQKFDKTRTCIKCKVTQGNVVIRHAVYCKDCFPPHMTFKFRRSLEPFVNPKPQGPRRTALKPTGNLLVGFSGGLGSTILLDLIHRCYVASNDPSTPTDGGRDHPRHEKVWKKITVCYIEISDAFPGMKNRTAEVEEAVRRYDGVDFVSMRIQDAFDAQWWKSTGRRPCSVLRLDSTSEELRVTSSDSVSTPLEALQSHLDSLPTATAVPSTVQTLIRLLLLHTAINTNSSHLVLGTTLTNLAVSLISGVSQGMGFNVRDELQEEWTPEEAADEEATADGKEDRPARSRARRNVRVIRPMRDIGMKECAVWAWWMGLKVVGKATWQSTSSKHAIGTLTKDFIMGLEKDYPSTVSTIVRTCGKVAPKGDVVGKCAMCERPVPQGIQDWNFRISIRSHLKPDFDGVDGTNVGGNLSHPDPSTTASLAPYLCYACHTTLTSKSNRSAPTLYSSSTKPSEMVLPMWTGSRLIGDDVFVKKLKMDEKEMRSTVRDFLLDD